MAYPFEQRVSDIEVKIELNAFPHPLPGNTIVGITSDQYSEEVGGVIEGENFLNFDERAEESIQEFPGAFNREWELNFED